jgi:hypothetical protein
MKPMNLKALFICASLCWSFTGFCQNFNLRINEIIASNANGQMDDFFETDDWIEIYNPPGSPITNLAGYYLSDNPLNLTKWKIRSTNAGVTTILPNNFLIFWCDSDSLQGEDHTGHFTLSADGESIILTAPDGTSIIDQVDFPQCASDISYGRVCDGCEDWVFFNNVTFDDNNLEIHDTDNLYINEVQTQNISYFADLQGEFDQWFEVYNPNNYQVNLGGYYVGTNGDPLQWQIPQNNPYRTVVPALGYLLIWCDNDALDDTNHAPFLLDAGAGQIQLTGPDAITEVDLYAYPAMGSNESFGRQSDGASSSIIFTAPTPTVTNQLEFVSAPVLYINELLSANNTDLVDNVGELEDWFEIYNPNDFPVNLGGYYFSDNIENPTKWRVPIDYPDSVTVDANSWLLFYADDDAEQGVLHVTFKLSNNEETLRLYTPDGFTLIDYVSWQDMDPDTTLGRLTDGSEEWVYFTETTPEASNNGATIHVQQLDGNALVLFPNPTSDFIRFNQIRDVQLFSAQGQLLRSGKRIQSMPVDDLQPGVYLLVTDQKETFRVIVY